MSPIDLLGRCFSWQSGELIVQLDLYDDGNHWGKILVVDTKLGLDISKSVLVTGLHKPSVWLDVTPEVGQVYLKGGVEYKVLELTETEVYLGYSDSGALPCYVSPTYAEFFTWWELGEEIDDCSSYTEGYRAGCSGLRWL